MASSKMFLSNYHDGDEWSINEWPYLSVMSGYSLETTYFMVHSSLVSAVLFICRVFSSYSLAPSFDFFTFLFLTRPLKPRYLPVVFCFLDLCAFQIHSEKGVEAPFTLWTELCDLWAALPCAQCSMESYGVFPSCFPEKKKGDDP